MKFIYDHTGVVGVVYANHTYIYRKNPQGDIIAILDESGTVVTDYAYDAWGNYLVGTNIGNIGDINPFRYRGYYYDTELDLYYLNSRYYDPTTGRFVNADNVENLSTDRINGLNLYCYSMNNPVMYSTSVMNALPFSATTYNSQLQPVASWVEPTLTGLDHTATMLRPSYLAIWALTKYGRRFVMYNTMFTGRTAVQVLDDLAKPLGKATSSISWAIIGINAALDIYNSIQQGYSFEQGATSLILTVGVSIGTYYASVKLGALAGSAVGGALGMIVGAVAGIVIAVSIDWCTGLFIDWIMDLWG